MSWVTQYRWRSFTYLFLTVLSDPVPANVFLDLSSADLSVPSPSAAPCHEKSASPEDLHAYHHVCHVFVLCYALVWTDRVLFSLWNATVYLWVIENVFDIDKI